MKRILSIAMLFLCLLHTAMAQVSRSNTKKSVPYRANYQRMSTSGNSYHNFEIRNGTLWGWGRNLFGEIGDGTTGNQRNAAVQIGTDNKWVTVATGGMHTLALKADGTLWAWGYNGNGQLGNGTTTNRTTPLQIGTETNWTSVVAGSQFSIALKANGTLWAWGYNNNGQLGNGTINTRSEPVMIGTDTKWTAISAGSMHTLALKADGTLWAWGNNIAGQIGDGTNANKIAPVQIGTETKWTNIAAGNQHSLALKADGTLWSWGLNSNGQLGVGNTSSLSVPTRVGTDNTWVTISAGDAFTTALKVDGTFWTWGANANGQLGDGTNINKTSPIQIGSDTKWVSVFAGATHTIALKADGTLWSWGANAIGQVGDGSVVQKANPVQIKGAPDEWIQIIAFQSHSTGIKADGTLWAWGSNSYGQLGDGTTIDKIKPVQVGIDNNWISVTEGFLCTLALKSDGTLWYCGNGNSTLSPFQFDTYTPVQVDAYHKWSSISTGHGFILALKANGTLWSTGDNLRGQLGVSTSSVLDHGFAQIGIDNYWTSATCKQSSFTSAGLKSDGTLWTWGDNFNGQLGDGTKVNKSIPVRIGTDTKWTAVSVCNHAIALKADGSLYAWGSNSSGQLGDGTNIDRLNPVPIAIGTTWIAIGIAQYFSSGLKSDGKVSSWGSNSYGELGYGNNSSNGNPLINVSSETWLSISPGYYYNICIKAGGLEFCATGANESGQLGDGTLTNRNTFGCIPLICAPPNNILTIFGPSDVCASSTNRIFTVANSISTASYIWIVPTGATIVSGQGTTTLTVNWGTTSGFVSVTETNACGATGTASSKSVTIFPAAALPIISSPASICPGAINQVFTVSNADAGRVYTWTVPNWVNIASGQGTASLAVNWGSAAGTITVAETTCSAGIAVAKTVALATPNNALVIDGPVSVCSYNNYVYTVTNSVLGASYNWVVPSGSTLSGQGTNSINVTFGTTAGTVTVSETTVCGTGSLTQKLVNVSTSYYAIANTDPNCGGTFAVPLKTIGAIGSGVIGLDFAINYNASLLTPTGSVQTGPVATSYGSYSINTTIPGKVYVSVYLNNAPNGTYFNGSGDVAYVYFQVNAGAVAGTALTLTTDGIEESTPVNANMRCAAVPLSTTIKTAVSGTLIYRNTAGALLKYDPTNPAAYVPSTIAGTNSNCVPTATGTTKPDLSGVFKYSPANGTSISIERDINGDLNVPTLNCSNVQAVINSMDRIQAADIATYKTTNVPIYTLLSADVNLDGKVTAGDVSLISSRSINANNCEFPQSNYTWNGTALVPASGYVKSQDWLFVDDATLASAAFTTGTGRNNVPKVPSCLPAPIGTASCTPTSSAIYHAILLGDVDGSWTSANGALMRTSTTDAIIVDISQATVNAVGNYVVPVFYQTEGSYYGMDFSLDYAQNITVHQVRANPNQNTVGAEFNSIAQQRLMVTSYTQDPISTTSPIAYIEVSSSSALTPNNFSNAQGYLNGQPADLKFSFDDAPAKNTAQVDVYPNPFHTETYIYAVDTNPYVSISIFDISGALVYENSLVPANEKVVLNQLTQAGIYLVRITCSNGTVTKKLIKI